MKPVASGCRRTPSGLRNDDALALQAASAVPVAYDDVNPYAFEPPIAPHIAARLAHVTIEVGRITAAFARLAGSADCVVAEGAGGWRVPLAPDLLLSDLPGRLGLDTVLVVGLRLGCLNHAMLTAEAIEREGPCGLVGWIGCQIEPDMDCVDDNVATLRERLRVPCLGTVPHDPGAGPQQVAAGLDVRMLRCRDEAARV